jgi:alpha-galactosidase
VKLRLDAAAPFVLGGPDGLTDVSASCRLEVTERSDAVGFRISNDGASDVSVRSCGLVVPLEVTGPVRLFVNGYQSWSPTGWATLGVDVDPSHSPDAFELFCAALHADQRRAGDGELRSELVTVLADRGDDLVMIGWTGGDRHDGTIRLRPSSDGRDDRVEVVLEAFLGGAVLPAGSSRDLHEVELRSGGRGDAAALLADWARRFGRAASARTNASYQVGWCSWYHYFERIDEAALAANLAAAADWPFDVFQLDDGFQSHIGDWRRTNDSFPDGIEASASAITAAGRRPGLWLAPFLAHPESEVHRAHPDWIARQIDVDAPLPGGINDIWGGIVHALDTTNPEVLDHLEGLARDLVAMGFTYLKLDFTYAPSFDGVWSDPTRTPAERVRAGYDAIRRGAGDDTFILGCGAPLGPCVGVVDGMRIGPDVAPSWDVTGGWAPEGYRVTLPSVANAWRSTAARAFMHRSLWLNDPDCLMLRTDATSLAVEQVAAWAEAVAASGGMALVSDDLSLLGADARALLDDVIDAGGEVDAAAIAGEVPTVPSL